MIALIQRVATARVTVKDNQIAKIGKGFLILLGVITGDHDTDLDYLVKKITKLRIMSDEAGKMNLDLAASGGSVLVVSQFILAGDVSGGNRPSFIKAAEPAVAEKYYHQFVAGLRAANLTVKTGNFGDYMQVDLTNDGPTTIIIDSKMRK